MSLRISTNVASLNAQRNLYNNTMKLNKSLERLSSGLRINRAGDDAAGLAISENLKSDIRALEQSARNAGDGISMIQVAEGALSEVSDILIRMRELTQQAANETMGATQRGYLDDEFQALMSEIDRVSTYTEFNGTNLLDGTDANAREIQVGLVAADVITIDFTTAVDSAALGIDAASLAGADNANATAAITLMMSAIDDLSTSRAAFGAVQNRLESSIRSLHNSVENLSAANSAIRDVDIAAETSRMISSQILQQAGVSVLAQANMAPQMALMLLQ